TKRGPGTGGSPLRSEGLERHDAAPRPGSAGEDFLLAVSTGSVTALFSDGGEAAKYCRTPVSMGCQLTWNVTHNSDVARTYTEWLDGDSLITLVLRIILT